MVHAAYASDKDRPPIGSFWWNDYLQFEALFAVTGLLPHMSVLPQFDIWGQTRKVMCEAWLILLLEDMVNRSSPNSV